MSFLFIKMNPTFICHCDAHIKLTTGGMRRAEQLDQGNGEGGDGKEQGRRLSTVHAEPVDIT